jgi:Heavy metal binding domain
MINKSMKSILTILSVIIISASFSFAQNMMSTKKDSMKMDHQHMQKMDMKKDSTSNIKMMDKKMDMKNDMHKMKMDSTKKMQSSIIRKGVIDVKSIDKNKDGKVFQDMMDYNVISDKPGKCPICGMKLKEVSIEKAKEILLKSGFKVEQ